MVKGAEQIDAENLVHLLEELAHHLVVEGHKAGEAGGIVAIERGDALQVSGPADGWPGQHHLDLLQQKHQLRGAAGVFPHLGEQVVH